MDFRFEDFTEHHYTVLLRLAIERWRFIEFPASRTNGWCCLWRHDVDFSLQRARRLAEIEAREGVTATYFIHLHSEFYNPFDPPNAEAVQKIVKSHLCTKEKACVSFHNPDVTGSSAIVDDEMGGMINASGAYLRANYRYCSDSNGYWRSERLHDVLTKKADVRLHVLTHPGWWTPKCSSPRDRVSRCIDGRAASQHQRYDDLLERAGRNNIR